ncbi:hypothetical protein DRF62_17525 [Chryseobacterium piscium]|jgi:hypothetical protein|uniref:Uncharacterized protein n=2 Tax=Chryseobacterium piscium TaxID=333702 RepID=A0A3D9BD30_9FLAO|nr:hypothetical protein DRF62_17525 [Chryseobacterium piscium]
MEIYFGKVFDELGVKLDEAFNGIMLPPLNKFDEVVEAAKSTLKESDIPINFWNRAKHQTHPEYNEMIKTNLNRVFDGFENLSLADKAMVKQEFLGFIRQRKV